jgi:hypothetical protein
LPALVQVKSTSGNVLFEGEASAVQLQEMAIGDRVRDVITDASVEVAAVGNAIRACTQDLLAVFDDLATDKRDGGSFSAAIIELGVTVTAEGNVVVVKGSAEANLKVTLSWDFG